MTVNPLTVELVIRGDLDRIREVLDLLDDTAPPYVPPVRSVPTTPGLCGEQHPHYGTRCALPEGHDGRHDPEPHLPVPTTAGEVEDAPVKQAPEHRGEAVERPASPAPDAGGGDEAPSVPPAGPRASSAAQRRMLFATFGSLGYTDEELGGREARLQVISAFAGRVVESSNDLTNAEAKRVIDTLAPCKTRADVENIVGRMLERASR